MQVLSFNIWKRLPPIKTCFKMYMKPDYMLFVIVLFNYIKHFGENQNLSNCCSKVKRIYILKQ